MMLSTLSWWLVIQLFGLATLPLAWRLFERLPSRGYPLAKALGLLLVSYALWIGATFRLLPNSAGGVLAALLLVAAVSGWLGRAAFQRREGNGRPLVTWLRANRWPVLAAELLFLVVFVGWVAFRAYNPDIAGTEKPMEFAFINGVLGSRFFPPQDPWLSGYSISYYYFGYVMLGALIRLTGVDPAWGFNLGVASWYALVMIGAFGISYDLVQGLRSPTQDGSAEKEGDLPLLRRANEGTPHTTGRGMRYGLLGALFVGFLGNLEGLVEMAYNRGLAPMDWIRWLDIKQLTDSPPTGGWTGGFWWWWRASRVIHDRDLLGNSIEVIDEFPFFSFLLGDMHPHVLALPFALLAIALALNLLLGARGWKLENRSSHAESTIPEGRVEDLRPKAVARLQLHMSDFWTFAGSITGLGSAGILLYALLLGALVFLNTWDFPIYVTLAALSIGAGLALRNGVSSGVLGRAFGAGVVFALLGWLWYFPFFLGFQSQLGGILPNLLFPTRLSQFLLMFGPFLAITIFFMIALSRGGYGGAASPANPINDAGPGGSPPRRSVLRGFLYALPWTLLVPLLVWGLVTLGLAILPQGRELVNSLLENPAVRANIGAGSPSQLAALALRLRAATPWTYLFLAVLIAWVSSLIWVRLPPPHAARDSASGGTMSGTRKGAAHEDRADLPPEERSDPSLRDDDTPVNLFALLMIGLALLLTLAVEFVYLRDLFGTRMNTVFKFYFQAWILLALASTYALSRLAGRRVSLALKVPALAVAGLLVLGGLFYPLAAIPSKADDFHGQPTLDGLAYLRRFDPADMAAIEWIRANVPPDAVVLEASGGSYSPEGAERVSMATGNPTLLGWDFHEMQWRGSAYSKLAAGRPEALDQIYRTASAEELRGLLAQWGVDYVYIGALERNKYGIGEAALARFDRALTRVYPADNAGDRNTDGVIIYAR